MLPRRPRLSLPVLARWVRFNSGGIPTEPPTEVPPVPTTESTSTEIPPVPTTEATLTEIPPVPTADATPAEITEMSPVPTTEPTLTETPPESVQMTPLTEPELASMVIRGRSLYPPTKLPRPHSIPVAEIHLRSHHHYYLDIFAHFIGHAASALGIPASGAVPLPTQRSLWTVLRGPFVHKKSQENFERRVHKRVIKAWDADQKVVDMWVKYMVKHQMPGVGIRVTRWERAPLPKYSLGASRRQSGSSAQQVKEMAEKIVAQELSRDSTASSVTTPRLKS